MIVAARRLAAVLLLVCAPPLCALRASQHETTARRQAARERFDPCEARQTGATLRRDTSPEQPSNEHRDREKKGREQEKDDRRKSDREKARREGGNRDQRDPDKDKKDRSISEERSASRTASVFDRDHAVDSFAACKISARLRAEIDWRRGTAAKPVRVGAPAVQLDEHERALVDIRGRIPARLRWKIEALKGTVVSQSLQYRSIVAWVPLRKLETLAQEETVVAIDPAPKSVGVRKHGF